MSQTDGIRTPVLVADEVSVHFGGILALDRLSLTIHEGQICGLIGPNGAGKTTMFNVVSRIYDPSSGDLLFRGQRLLDVPPHGIAELGIARTFQNLALFPTMTLLENVVVGAHSHGHIGFTRAILRIGAAREARRMRKFAGDLLRELGLGALAFHPAAGLPFGTLKRLEIARALAAWRAFLLMDEPAAGLTHGEVDELGEAIRMIRDQFSLTILLVEHHMALVMGISDKVVVMENGRRIAEGPPEAVRNDPAVITAYLGTRLMSLLDVEDLRAGYGEVNVLHDLELRVGEGEIVVVLGANGAGKTTTMRALAGTIHRSGRIEVDGVRIDKARPDSIVARGVALVPQGRGTFRSLSVEDNLRLGGYLRPQSEVAEDLERWYDTFPRLHARRGGPAGLLSGGEQQMLAIARAMMSRPRLLLLDEPSLGLAPIITENLFASIGELNQTRGLAVLLVEQNVNLAIEMAHRVYLLETGRIVASGSSAEMSDNDAIRMAYLGTDVETFFQHVFDGLSIGSIYALLVLAIVVVYRGTGQINFAQGEMATLAVFFAWFLQDRGVPLPITLLAGIAAGFAIGMTAEVLVVRPLAKRSQGAVFVAIIALFIGINALMNGVWGALPEELVDNLFPADPDDFVRIFGAVWRYEYIGTLLVALALTGLLFTLFQRTRFGLAMRGVADNGDSCQLVGVRIGTVLAVSWGLAGALGSAGALLFASIQGQVTPSLMVSVLVYGVAAATLGGLDSPGGAVVAGLVIGVGESLAVVYAPESIGQEMKLAVALLAIFAVLLFKPSGLFGSPRIERV